MPVQSKNKKILVTGGHQTPALAVIAELKKRGYTNFIWVGQKYNQFGTKTPSPEFQTVSKLKIPFIHLTTGKLVRHVTVQKFPEFALNLLKIPYGFFQAMIIVIRERPHLVISFGGYWAVPIVIWAKLIGRKILTHEQTTVAGLANEIIARFANKILLSWHSSQQFYPPEKTVLTGNPLRPEIFTAHSNNFNFTNNLPVIYITGGNQSSHVINAAVFRILPELLKIANVIHQIGSSTVTQDSTQAATIKAKLSKELQGRYQTRSYIFAEEIGEVFAKANLIISRAGANVTYELLALGKPVIFIPIPWASHNEQVRNATLASETGLAVILPQGTLSPKRLMHTVKTCLATLAQGRDFRGRTLAEARAEAQKLIRLDAAKVIGDIAQKLL